MSGWRANRKPRINRKMEWMRKYRQSSLTCSTICVSRSMRRFMNSYTVSSTSGLDGSIMLKPGKSRLLGSWLFWLFLRGSMFSYRSILCCTSMKLRRLTSMLGCSSSMSLLSLPPLLFSKRDSAAPISI